MNERRSWAGGWLLCVAAMCCAGCEYLQSTFTRDEPQWVTVPSIEPADVDLDPKPDAAESPAPLPDAFAPWLADSDYNRMYAASREQVTVVGTVREVATFLPAPGGHEGLRLTVTTREGDVTVHVGPRQYASASGMRFNFDDTVNISGAIVPFDQGHVLMARRIIRGNTTVNLREADGTPLWTTRDLLSMNGPAD